MKTEPRLTIHEVRWLKDKADWVEVVFTPSVLLRGGDAIQKWSPLKLTCQSSEAKGDRVFDVAVGTAEPRRTVRVPVPSEALGKPDFNLAFSVDEPSAQKSSDGLTVPLLAGTVVQVPVKLPGIGNFSVPFSLSLELTPKQLVSDLQQLSFAFELTLRPEKVPANILVEPASLTVKREQLAPPSLVRTQITAQVQSTSAGPWTDLRQALASHALEVSFTLQGPIPAGTLITLVAPAAVRHIEFSPRTLRTGKQTLKIKLRSEAKPTPAVADITLQLIPPRPLGAVEFDCQPNLRLALPGPKAVRLLVGQAGELPTELTSAAADNDDITSLPVEPLVSGMRELRTLGNLKATATSSTLSLAASPPQALDFFSPTSLRLRLPDGERPFFQDTVIEGDVQFQPSPPTPAVIGARYPVTIVVQAPFKRLLAILAITVSSVLAIVLLCWMVTKLRHQRS